jgi:hypothetical protein
MKKGGGFPYLIAANITNGDLLWGFRADPHEAAIITQSPTIFGGAVYVGISSLEELIADNPEYNWWVLGLGKVVGFVDYGFQLDNCLLVCHT